MRTHRIRILSRIFCAWVLIITGCQDAKPSIQPSASVPDDTRQQSGGQLSAEHIRAAIRLKNHGLAYLENKEWSQADVALSELVFLLPRNRLAVRNLAIARILAIVDRESPFSRRKDKLEYERAVAAAKEAVSVLTKVSDADRPLADMMQGMLCVHDDAKGRPRFIEGLALLRKAAAESGNRIDFKLAMVQAMEGQIDNAESPELLQTLQECSQLAPQNLDVLMQLLALQAMTLKSTNPQSRELALQLTESLKTVDALLEPLNQAILEQRRIDLKKIISDTLATFDGHNVDGLIRTAMITRNVMVGALPTTIDRRNSEPNLFRELLFDFDADFHKQAQAAGVWSRVDLTVVKGFTAGQGLPQLSAVTDAEFMDINLDGAEDLVVASEGRIRVFSRVTGDQTKWQLLTESPIAAGTLTRFVLADLDRDSDQSVPAVRSAVKLRDRDGDPQIVTDPNQKHRWFDTDVDVIAWSADRIALLRNQRSNEGVRSLETIPMQNSVSEIRDVIATDVDDDGDLDIVSATDAGLAVLQNIDGTKFATHPGEVLGPVYGIDALTIGDWNSDVAMDIIGVSAGRPSGVLQNQFHGRFRWVTDGDGFSSVPQASMVRLADFDGNLSWDLMTAGSSGIQITFTQTSMTRTVSALRQTIISTQPVTAIDAVDLDNDGALDIIAVSSTSARLYRGLPDGTFTDLSGMLPAGSSGNGLCSTDFDDDGDADLVLISPTDGSLTLLINDGGNTNDWMDVVVRATGENPQFPHNRCNMHAIGSVLELRAGAACQARVIDKPRMHLGLGTTNSIDAVRVVWTDGERQNIMDTKLLQPRVEILVPQPLSGW